MIARQHIFGAAWSLLAAALLFSATYISYSSALDNTFVWDSIYYVVNNPHITNINFDNILWALSTNYLSNWHPLTWLSYMLDYQVYGGLSPRGFHLTNIILHGFNSWLVFHLTLFILTINEQHNPPNPSVTSSANANVAALAAALLFATHPQHVESVAWVAERKDLLFMLFLLLSFIAYVKFTARHQANRFAYYIASLLLFALALASKPMAVTFPAILLIADIYPLRRTRLRISTQLLHHTQTYRRLLLEKIPFIILTTAVILLTLNAQTTAFESLSNMPMHLRILNASNSIMLYIQKMIIPLHYSPYYPHLAQSDSTEITRGLISMLAVLAITFITILLWIKKHPAWLFAWMFYLITLSPRYRNHTSRYAGRG